MNSTHPWIDALPLREPPRQDRARRTVVRLLDAASDLVKTDGVGALTTGKVAEIADVPIGTVYRYFRDRDELVQALVGRQRFEMDAAITTEMAELSVDSWREGFRAMVEAVIRQARQRPGYLQLRALAQSSVGVRQAEAAERWVTAMLSSPVSGVLSGLDAADISRCAATIVAAVQGMLPHLYYADEAALPRLLDDTQQLVCSYVEAFGRARGVQF